jgi:hypothetical protein
MLIGDRWFRLKARLTLRVLGGAACRQTCRACLLALAAVTTAVEGAAVLLADVELAGLVTLTQAQALLRAAAYGYA